ncbi:ATP-binding protein [Desulfoplanes sp.]
MDQTQYLYPRFLETRIREAMEDTPVVLINGPRQSGKTTLARHVADGHMRYLTLDDELTLLAAREDPVGLIRSLDRAVIDEIQRAPQLVMAIKKSVDGDRRPGRFLVTGSANLITIPLVADSLAGRMETLTLLPLSRGEIAGTGVNWVDRVFAGALPDVDILLVGKDLSDAVLAGGYPEVLQRTTTRRRTAWIQQYIDAMIQRDVRDIAHVEDLDCLPRFLRTLAEVAGQMCNYSQLAGRVGLSHKTAARYIGIFEQMYLLKRIEVWSNNRLHRIVKTPKIQFVDSGVVSTMSGMTPVVAARERTRLGSVLETFVYGELYKHCTVAEEDYLILYYRDHDKFEVDFVIENPRSEIVGVEVKASATVSTIDLRGLKRLRDIAGDTFLSGVLLYDGEETLPLGDRLWAAPLSTLWGA